jgi:hypothetical protein
MIGGYKTGIQDHRVESETNKSLLLIFNNQLDEKSNFFSLNEGALESLIDRLDSLVSTKDELYWLTLARITELVLLCAGNYANNGEFGLMGDLLLNPRLVLIHIRGQHRPIVKKRHTLLTDQFRHMAESKTSIIQWLKEETIVEIKIKALLPHLVDKSENSSLLGREYIDSIHHRTKQIADLVVFLHGTMIKDSQSLFTWMNNASPADRAMIQDKRCRVNLDSFFALGQQIRRMAQIPLMNHAIQNQKSLLESRRT